MSAIEEARKLIITSKEHAEAIYKTRHLRSFDIIMKLNNALDGLITKLEVAEKVVDAAKSHIHFDLKLYLRDKELGNLEHRDKKVIRLLDSLKEYEELK